VTIISVVVRVSYTQDRELQQVLTLLQPVMQKHKKSKEKKGEHMNAYIYLNDGKTL
jgi:hypothetical protein